MKHPWVGPVGAGISFYPKRCKRSHRLSFEMDSNVFRAKFMTVIWKKTVFAVCAAVMLISAPAAVLAQETSTQPRVVAPETPVVQTPEAQVPAQSSDVTSPASTPIATQQPLAVEAAGRDQRLPHDLSPWGMFMAADIVVKIVMIGLAIASLTTWTVWVAKSLELAGARRRVHKALKVIGHAATLSDAARNLHDAKGPAAIFVHAAEDEMRLSMAAVQLAGGEGLKDRVASRLARIESKAGRRLSKGTGALATIGSVAPFVGLFGTVWGIMNSFINISEAQTTNLAVVAPGIAEALLATAIGLVAAIPAVVIYNVFARSITGYRQTLADASAGVERLVSRDLDFRAAGLQKASVQQAAE